jgi:hypothetical protein
LKNTRIENEIIAYEIKNGILYGQYKVASINLEFAKTAVQLRKDFTNGLAYPNLVRGFDVISIEKKARDFFATPDATMGVLAGALITNSIFQATLANFFLKVSNPKIPTKLFTDERKAIEWLEQYIAK